ncbi:MAG: AmmeMemoRadiSam system radical SAM enzyme [Thermodesulfobacteriota bacterium]
MYEARLYRKGEKGRVHCYLCSHGCSIGLGKRGLCGVRENRDGTLYSLVYGRIVAEHVDPVEKKPLFHVLPGSYSYSISTVGCNFSCRHCQNSSISQPGPFPADDPPGLERTAQQIVDSALAAGCRSISYTYVEPTIFFEFAHDCMVLARQKGLKNIFVSNGYMSKEAAAELAPVLDAINIDLKSFSDEFYKTVCGARLQPVLDSIRRMYEAGVEVEVTTLIIPDLNNSDEELKQIAAFLASVDPAIPWHVTGFYPSYKMMDRRSTTAADLDLARKIGAEAGLQHVYDGNLPGSGGENTSCPSCGREVILRRGFSVRENRLSHGKCPSCESGLYGIWE